MNTPPPLLMKQFLSINAIFRQSMFNIETRLGIGNSQQKLTLFVQLQYNMWEKKLCIYCEAVML